VRKLGSIKINTSIRLFLVIGTGAILICLMAANNGITINKHGLTSNDTTKWPASFGFGHTATVDEIAKWDISIRSDGKGLPAGDGNASKGAAIYTLKCAACHGAGGKETPGVKLSAPALVSDTVAKTKPKTIGNYWPYATTLFDYVRRAMPYNLPGSLTDNEVYSVTAYLLSANKIIGTDAILNAQSLPKVIMPAKKLFIVDDRKGGPEVK
jgi:S-disulfanyl-L-cysteine oxidoreductase SoxD